MTCAILSCNKEGVDPHHIWRTKPKMDCVYQKGKTQPPGNIVHEPGCKCNIMRLCRSHHTGDKSAHLLGDVWLYEQTLSPLVYLKLKIRGKL